MKNRQRRVAARKRAARPGKQPEQYAAINLFVASNRRDWFSTEEDAIQEAINLQTGNRVIPGYKPPARMAIVKLVGIVEAATTCTVRPPALDDIMPFQLTPMVDDPDWHGQD